MRRGIMQPRGLKVRRYAASLTNLDEYLDVFPAANMSDFLCVTELNEKFSKCVPNIWIKQENVQGFDYEYIAFKADVNLF